MSTEQRSQPNSKQDFSSGGATLKAAYYGSSEIARPLLPVGHLVRQTYHAAGYHAGDMGQLGAVPLLLVVAVQTLYVFSPTIANLIFSILGNVLASSIFAVGLNRLVLDNEKPRFGIHLGRREWLFFMFSILTIAPVFLIMLALFGGGFLLSRAMHSDIIWHASIVVGVVASLLLASYAAVRFSFVFPSIALDRPMALKVAVRQTHLQGSRIWIGLLLCLSPVFLVTGALTAASFIYKMPTWSLQLIHGFGAISALPLAVIFLALNYERLMLGRVIEREYVVLPKHSRTARGNSAWLRRLSATVNFLFNLLLFAPRLLIAALQSIKPKPKAKSRAPSRRASQPPQLRSRPATVVRKPSSLQQNVTPQDIAQDVIVRGVDHTHQTSSIRMVVEMNGLDPQASALVHLMAENLRHLDEKTMQRVTMILSGQEAPPENSHVSPSHAYTEEQTRAIITALLPNASGAHRTNRARSAQILNDLVKKA